MAAKGTDLVSNNTYTQVLYTLWITMTLLSKGGSALKSSPGTKRLFLLRHGQAQHNPRAEKAHDAGCSYEIFMNLMKEDDALDAALTDLGVQQARGVISNLSLAQRLQQVELVVSSPLSRAISTADLAIEGVNLQLQESATNTPPASFDPKRVCLEQWREINGLLLNAKRRPRNEMQNLFPKWDTSLIVDEEDKLWNEHELEEREECAERGYQGLLWLLGRPETDIMLVAHGGIFRFLFLHHPNLCLLDKRPFEKRTRPLESRFSNCELREYELSPHPPSLLELDDHMNQTSASHASESNAERPVIYLTEVTE